MMTVSMTRNASYANWSCWSTPSLSGREIVPFCGRDSPVSSFMNVDLPDPLGPVRPGTGGPWQKVVVTSSKKQLRAEPHGDVVDSNHRMT